MRHCTKNLGKTFVTLLGFLVCLSAHGKGKTSYTVIGPPGKDPLPILFDSPHSGRWYPDDFQYDKNLKFNNIRRAEDAYVDLLLEAAPAYGITVLAANFPRSYVDVNRSLDDVDIDMIEDRSWDAEANPAGKSLMGIGLFRRFIIPGMAIYDRKLKKEELWMRISRYYRPYHAKLAEIARNMQQTFGQFYHLDVHSMKSESNAMTPEGAGFKRPDIVLGNLGGTSASPEFTEFVFHKLQSLGYVVTLNNPYRGAEIIRRTGNPRMQRHALQIEINRALYLNEEMVTLNKKKYAALKKNMQVFFKSLREWLEGRTTVRAAR